MKLPPGGPSGLDVRLAAAAAMHARYRPDVDGLRAVAVLGVLIFHAVPESMPGGFAGVDVFFVISGYLISSIIFRGLERGGFSCGEFYVRRIKRIFPALIAMLLAVWMLAWPTLLWDEYQRLGKHIVAGAGFALNLVLYSDFNLYFGVTTSPLIHLWSLGVEEQFYIVWPLLMIGLWKWCRPSTRLHWLVAVALISFGINIASLSADPTTAFYLPISRIWELALGSVLACAQLRGFDIQQLRALPGARWVHHLCGWLGAILLAASFWKLKGSLAYPGWWALLPCTGALLLIAGGPESWINRHVLSHRLAVFIGLISYPLYLWHWPLLSMVHIFAAEQAGYALIATAILAAFILAFLTYKYIELPIRTSRSTPPLVASLCTAMVACAGLGWLTYVQAVRPRSATYALDTFIHATREDWFSEQKSEWTWHTDGLLRVGSGRRQTLFIGDSNMQQYYPRMAKLLDDHEAADRQAVFAVKPGCALALTELVHDQITAQSLDDCRRFLATAMSHASRPEVEAVVLAAYWRGYAIEGARNIADFRPHPLRPSFDLALEALREHIESWVAQGKRVYVVLNIPTSLHFDPRQMIKRQLRSPSFAVHVSTPTRAEVEAVLNPITSKVRHMATVAGAQIIDPMDWLCNRESCPAVTERGEPIYRDFGHLRPTYVREQVRFLDTIVLDSPQVQTKVSR